MRPQFDEQDAQIRAKRSAAFDAKSGPRCGDFVEFSDGVTRRISYIWDASCIQTSDSGSWYLGDGYLSFSGALHQGVPAESLALTDEIRFGACWFFHHDSWGAHRGVETQIPCRVYRCNLPAPK